MEHTPGRNWINTGYGANVQSVDFGSPSGGRGKPVKMYVQPFSSPPVIGMRSGTYNGGYPMCIVYPQVSGHGGTIKPVQHQVSLSTGQGNSRRKSPSRPRNQTQAAVTHELAGRCAWSSWSLGRGEAGNGRRKSPSRPNDQTQAAVTHELAGQCAWSGRMGPEVVDEAGNGTGTVVIAG